MDLRTLNNFLEKFWLMVAIGTMVYGLYYVNSYGLEGNHMYLILPIIAFAFFLLRSSMRRRLEKKMLEDQNTEVQD